MNPLLDQFLGEGREFLQSIGERLLQLEDRPGDGALMDELFRFVHTLKGNSGLFDLPEMTRVLHAAEDLLDAVRDGRVPFGRALADQLLEAMDFVAALLDEIAASGADQPPSTSHHAGEAARLGAALRQLLGEPTAPAAAAAAPGTATVVPGEVASVADAGVAAPAWHLEAVPEATRMACYRDLCGGAELCWLRYAPEADCFFKGEDPLFQMVQLPPPLWRRVVACEDWPDIAELDAYRCALAFEAVLALDAETLREHFRYVADQVEIRPLNTAALLFPSGRAQDEAMAADFRRAALSHLDAQRSSDLIKAARTLLELSAADLWIASVLRWLLLSLEFEPGATALHRSLIESLQGPGQSWSPPATVVALALREMAVPAAALAAAPTAAPGSERPAIVSSSAAPPLAAETREACQQLLAAQRAILNLPDAPGWLAGRLRGVASSLAGICITLDRGAELPGLEQAVRAALADGSAAALRDWVERRLPPAEGIWSTADGQPAAAEGDAPAGVPAAPAAVVSPAGVSPSGVSQAGVSQTGVSQAGAAAQPTASPAAAAGQGAEEPVRFGRRAEDHLANQRTLKVDQAKIDHLMNLIGEMVVAKNALPYLAGRAETLFGVRELSREIKAQYGVINRIAEEMQDAIMQVRMLPVSFVFQRFPRLVRDIAHKLGNEVRLVMEGEATEADKNIIEALADPLIHLVRNSLDHGLETPQERLAAGKSREGRLSISARQESDRVLIEISDDGRGIDPGVIRRKAYEKGLIDETTADRLSDQEAVNLVFAAGFSTAERVSDLSGRGVGMDVVRDAISRVNGAIDLRSQVGEGTRVRLSLPLSMAVSNVMIIAAAGQRFGIPMDAVAETVRVPRAAIYSIKQRLTTVLRGRLVPLVTLNGLLGLDAEPLANDDEEFAVLVVRIEQEYLGIIVDDCRETIDIILKPLAGFLGGLSGYAGSALLGDGSVLLVLNPRELL